MKKLIGIILALCMLSTMASAATPTISDENVDQKAMTVSFKYAGIAEGAQATMLAYEVTDAMIKEKAIPDFVDNTTTPIKGIDQEGVDADGFSFKVAEGYTGKIVVKIGGTDMDPVAFLVEFKKATQRVTFIWGDVNSDGYVNDLDGNNILSFYYGGAAELKERTLNEAFAGTSLWGDVNADGYVNDLDGNNILSFYYGGSAVINGTLGTYTLGSVYEILEDGSIVLYVE